MTTEVWFRNPRNYIREMAEAGCRNIVWDRGMLVKTHADPVVHAELHFTPVEHFRILVVGEQGTMELRKGFPLPRPFAVYPTWSYGDSFDLLEELCASPVGEDSSVFDDKDLPIDERPVEGQEHRVVVTHVPNAATSQGKQFIRLVSTLQRDYPDCIIHYHGTYSWRVAFGFGFRSADVDPRFDAQKGGVVLPNGKKLRRYESAIEHKQWVDLLNYRLEDLKIPRNRCMFNMHSAEWAGANYLRNVKFRTTGRKDLPLHTRFAEHPETRNVMSSPKSAQEGDKFLCDTCSLNDVCKYYREGAVCSVPGSQASELAKMFGSRDPDQIISGLSRTLAVQAERVQRAADAEEDFGEEIDPEVTKMINSLFTNGVKMAKLLNPDLNGKGTQVGVFVQNGRPVAAGTPNQLMAGAIAELEAQGVKREDITPKMIQNLLGGGDEEEVHQRAVGESGTIEIEG